MLNGASADRTVPLACPSSLSPGHVNPMVCLPPHRQIGLLFCTLSALTLDACSAPVTIERIDLRTAYEDLNRTALSSNQLVRPRARFCVVPPCSICSTIGPTSHHCTARPGHRHRYALARPLRAGGTDYYTAAAPNPSRCCWLRRSTHMRCCFLPATPTVRAHTPRSSCMRRTSTISH